MVLMAVLIYLSNIAVHKTSTDEFCASCHIHPHATTKWKRSTHYDNEFGIRVHCVDCHLPPHGEGYLVEKAKTGMRDLWGKLFKDPESFNWEVKSQVEHAKHHVFETSCLHCHVNLFPLGLSKEGNEAHLYYEQQKGELHCINCHISVGHYDPDRLHEKNVDFGKAEVTAAERYTKPGIMDGHKSFWEYIPGSSVSFEMLAIPGGSFKMGSPAEEAFRAADEGPVREVEISPFFMSRTEVSWDAYLAFFKQTGAQGKTADAYLNADNQDVDAISGPTPPWGAPDQGWGKGEMPAITMTHYAAEVYCQWLSKITGKNYRLPTEAEWEYAARAGSSTPYFFEGDPKDYVRSGIRNKLFGADTTTINSYVTYIENSQARPRVPSSVNENPYGLLNMLGNVAEFCSDYYAEDAYENYPDGLVRNPTGPADGKEYVVRGGSYRDDAGLVRCAARSATHSAAWLKTDPQIPKSIWWYSDCSHVGFRVVCDYPGDAQKPEQKD